MVQKRKGGSDKDSSSVHVAEHYFERIVVVKGKLEVAKIA